MILLLKSHVAGYHRIGHNRAIFVKPHTRRDGVRSLIAKHGDGLEVRHDDGKRWALLMPDASHADKYRYQVFGADGFGQHHTFDSRDEAADHAEGQGYGAHDPGALDRLMVEPEWEAGMERQRLAGVTNGEVMAKALDEWMLKSSIHTMFAVEPTAAQKLSGEYRKLPLTWHGLRIRIEHPEGTVREGVDETGKAWRTVFRYAYGEIRGTEGMDGDPVDVYIGQFPNAPEVYIVQQMRRKHWDEQDEEKCFINFGSIDEAKAAYLEHYDDPRFFGGIRAMPVAEFVTKVKATRKAPGMIKGLLFVTR